MPMTDSGLSDAVKAAIIAQSGSPSDSAKLQKFCDAIGKAVVEYIKANALVQVIGVTPGPGTTTGTIT